MRDIKAGEELTTNYLHYQYHYYGHIYRQAELCKYWYFTCECDLCQASEEVVEDTQHWVEVLQNTNNRDIKQLTDTLHQLLTVFPKNHYFVLEVKRRIIENIGDFRVNNIEEVEQKWLEKKIEFCRDHLMIQSMVSPGLSEYRAYISAHIAEPLYWLSKNRFLDNKDSQEVFDNNIKEVAEHLVTVVKIWGQYRVMSSENIKARNALDLLEMLDNMYLNQGILDSLYC